ncbi:histidine phosphatase family protein [Cytobacillus sp. FJAT-54145]|uniref:Histidine phosphatase family protein n=1 Tax=Cytobacillus spartinae TaxID=3299023 RepID=A0ABW6KJU3_9BACI
MLYLYVTRHGETEWNVQKRMQGHLDSNLTAEGLLHAELLGKRLASVEFEAVISSPSVRTMQTSEKIIGDRTLPLKKDERLKEIHLATWEGKTHDEIKAMAPNDFDNFWNNPLEFRNDPGESFYDVKSRVETVIKDIEKTYQSGNVLVVSHAVVIKTLLMICKNNTLDTLWDPPFINGTSLSIIKIQNGKMDLILEGDTSHKDEVLGHAD